MNWNQFLMYLSAVYMVYYTCLILLDYLKKGRLSPEEANADELFFSEDAVPQLIVLEEDGNEPQPEIAAPASGGFSSIPIGLLEHTGGVKLKEVFDLVRIDAIECVKAIPF